MAALGTKPDFRYKAQFDTMPGAPPIIVHWASQPTTGVPLAEITLRAVDSAAMHALGLQYFSEHVQQFPR